MEDFTKGHQRHSKRNYLRRKQNERSSFFINVSDELPPTEGRGRYILLRRKQNERSSFSINVSDELPTTEGRRRYIFKERQR